MLIESIFFAVARDVVDYVITGRGFDFEAKASEKEEEE
jgi:hypothetical protein